MGAVRVWADALAKRDPNVLRVGYFGSCARGDWGVGSDVDLVVVVRESDRAFPRRAADLDTSSLPVPADVLVYTQGEWERMVRSPGLPRTVSREIVWVVDEGDRGPAS